jgi:hypothetical protein
MTNVWIKPGYISTYIDIDHKEGSVHRGNGAKGRVQETLGEFKAIIIKKVKFCQKQLNYFLYYIYLMCKSTKIIGYTTVTFTVTDSLYSMN